MSRKLQRQAREKRAQRDAAHTSFTLPSGPDAARAEALLSATASELLAQLASGATTAVELMSAYIARCHAVGYELGAVTEECYGEALAAAAASDARRAAGEPLGPLEGLPLSVKDCVDQAGYDTTSGMACRVFKPAKADAALVALARRAGAIPFVRSNVPQCLMVPESDNAVWGRACNPYAAGRTPGGSSGGEGALVASRCSPLGIGTDIGGSIRIPAAYCGLVGYKPTPERLSTKGMWSPKLGGIDGQKTILATAGPIARCVADAALLMRTWLTPAPSLSLWDLDPSVPCLPWKDEAYTSAASRPLRIGVMTHDGFWDPAAPCLRAVREAAEALRAAGHTVWDWSPAAPCPPPGTTATSSSSTPPPPSIDTRRACILYYAILGADGGLAGMRAGLSGEPLHPSYSQLASIAGLPGWLRPIVAWAARRILRAPRAADLITAAGGKSAAGLWSLVAEREAMRTALLAAWTHPDAGIDVLLCPATGLPALPHGGSKLLTPSCAPTFLWNMLNMPAGVVPVTAVTEAEAAAGYTCAADQKDLFAAAAQEAVAGSAGLPVGVQLVGKPFADETVVGAMAALEAALRAREGAASASAGAPESLVQAAVAAAKAAKGGGKKAK